jgi:CDP-diacylglycerol--glycerol-3-phosphate 3-phosphatidyltransferase
MLNLRVRPASARVVDPVAAALLRTGVTPRRVTVAGTLGVVARRAGLLPAGMFFTGTAVVFFSVLTDLLDGAMARRLGARAGSGPGWTAPATAPRRRDLQRPRALVRGEGDDQLLAGLALFCLVAGSIVSYAKARAEGLGMRCDVGLAERAERLILVLAATLLAGLGLELALPVGLWLLAAASAITVVQRLLEVRRQAALVG